MRPCVSPKSQRAHGNPFHCAPQPATILRSTSSRQLSQDRSVPIMMDETATLATNGTERLPLKTYTEKAYLDYSRYVILDRALPHLGIVLKRFRRALSTPFLSLGSVAGRNIKKEDSRMGVC